MNIRVNLTTSITDGTEVVFRSPVDCSLVTGLIVYYDGGSKEFAFADSHGNNVGDIDHLFAENAVVKVILDVTNAMAFVQNADTNAYIERTFVKTVNGVAPDENGNVVVEGGGPGGGIVQETDPTVPAWAKQPEKPTYTAAEVGALPSSTVIPTVPTKVSAFENDKGYLTEHQDLSGYAKNEDIPTKPEDIGAQPSGNYALKTEIPTVPVQSVNGKTGAVSLSASDVGARAFTWMPTAQEVGALPSTYTPPNQTADQVGADPKGTAANAVSQHNTADDSHNDIRLELKAINDRLTAFFDSDDQTLDELSEIVAYITSNKTLIDSITTSKVSVADIVNNLTTNASNKPLSAAQGVALKALIDAITVPTKLSQLTNDKGYLTQHQDISGKVDKAGLTLGRHADGLLYVFVDGQPVGDGVDLPTGGIDGYITPDKQIVFNNLPDGEYTLAYIADDGSVVPIGAMEKDTNVYYTVKSTLTNCTNSNSATQVAQGSAYSATITAKSGYELKSVTATMGGSAVTVTNGKINITSVTGNIVITAVAEEVQTADPTNFCVVNTTVNTAGYYADTNASSPSYGWISGGRCSSAGENRTDSSTTCLTNYIPVQNGDIVYVKGLDISTTAYSGIYKADKTAIKGFLMTDSGGSGYVKDINLTGEWEQFTINNASAGFVRICGTPSSFDLSGNTKTFFERCDINSLNIIVNIKRNGAWL